MRLFQKNILIVPKHMFIIILSSIPRMGVLHFQAKWQMLAAQNELLLQIN